MNFTVIPLKINILFQNIEESIFQNTFLSKYMYLINKLKKNTNFYAHFMLDISFARLFFLMQLAFFSKKYYDQSI